MEVAGFPPLTKGGGASHSGKVFIGNRLKLLKDHKLRLTREFGVTKLALFGSAARDAEDADSDIDILVAFDGPATSKRYFGVQFYLEDLLGRPVDLVTEKALRPELRPSIERDAIHV